MYRSGVMLRGFCLAAGLLVAGSAPAFDMGDMMNPSKWMGGNKDRDRYYDDYDYYGGPGYGYPGGPPGYGYGYGPGYGGAPGYGYGGAPGYGYGGAPGYGYGGAPAYGGAPGYGGTPASGAQGGTAKEAEIRQLRERLRQLEGGVQ